MSQWLNRWDHREHMRWAIPNGRLYSDIDHPVPWLSKGKESLCVTAKGSLGETMADRTMTGACHVSFVRSSNDPSLTFSTLSTITWPVSAFVRD